MEMDIIPKKGKPSKKLQSSHMEVTKVCLSCKVFQKVWPSTKQNGGKEFIKQTQTSSVLSLVELSRAELSII